MLSDPHDVVAEGDRGDIRVDCWGDSVAGLTGFDVVEDDLVLQQVAEATEIDVDLGCRLVLRKRLGGGADTEGEDRPP